MQDLDSFKKEYRILFPDWTEIQIAEYAEYMLKKYSTIKKDPNAIHLEYFHGLIDDDDIEFIESVLLKSGLVLSRFDKNGVVYASLQEFQLQISLLINPQITQEILLSLGTSALWDGLKQSAIYIWNKLKLRYYSVPKDERKSTINFGIKVVLDNSTSLDLKLDGDISERVISESLEKVIELLKATHLNERPRRSQLYNYNKSKKKWEEIDVLKELSKEAYKIKK